ncbi:hypothetical protein ACHAXS_000852 [Conticribra weissflogii]
MEFKVDTNIIDGTWAFQCKQFTNGTVKNVKTHFVLIRINKMMRKSMWRCLLLSSSLAQMESSRLFDSKTFHGLCKSPCAFWKYLIEKLGNCGLPQAPLTTASLLGKRSFLFVRLMI